MPDIPILLVIIIVVALVFDYTNGAHDSANAIASVVSTKVLSPKAAVIMAGVLNFAGAFLGTHVAETIGKGIVRPEMIMGCHTLLLAALAGTICWNFLSLYIGLPSSSSHALIGGLMGSGIVYSGWSSLEYVSILEKVIIPLFLSPLAGFITGYIIMLGLAWLTCRFRYKSTKSIFKKLQLIAAAFMALSHGMNDAQKTMGIIALAWLFFIKFQPCIFRSGLRLPAQWSSCWGHSTAAGKSSRPWDRKFSKCSLSTALPPKAPRPALS